MQITKSKLRKLKSGLGDVILPGNGLGPFYSS